MKIKVRVPATVANFGSGFDCIGAAVKLYNEIEITAQRRPSRKSVGRQFRADEIKIDIAGEGEKILSRKRNNAVCRAIQKVFNRLHYTPCSLHLKLEINVPLARGMGSSATAYIGGIVAGNILCGNKLSEKEIIDIATEFEGHPDNVIPYCNPVYVPDPQPDLEIGVSRDLCDIVALEYRIRMLLTSTLIASCKLNTLST